MSLTFNRSIVAFSRAKNEGIVSMLTAMLGLWGYKLLNGHIRRRATGTDPAGLSSHRYSSI